MATPKLAPELIPKTKGPANGFLNKVCINKPEIPRPEPTIIAVTAFGNLTFVIIISQVSFLLVPNRISNTSENGMFIEPKLMLVTKHSNKITVRIINEYV